MCHLVRALSGLWREMRRPDGGVWYWGTGSRLGFGPPPAGIAARLGAMTAAAAWPECPVPPARTRNSDERMDARKEGRGSASLFGEGAVAVFEPCNLLLQSRGVEVRVGGRVPGSAWYSAVILAAWAFRPKKKGEGLGKMCQRTPCSAAVP